MNKYLLLFSILIFTQSCNFFGYRNAPHEKYRRGLSSRDYSKEKIENWTAAGEDASNEELFIAAPLKLSGKSNKDQIEAWGYRIHLNAGLVLNLELLSNLSPDRLFLDFWFVEKDGNLDYLGSIKESSDFEYTILETGDYQIRIQPALAVDCEFELNILLKPAYEIFPVEGKGNKAIQSFWGDPRDGGKRKHEGIDIFAPKGTPLLAICDGEVDRVDNGGLGGKVVWIWDPELEQSLYYAHLDEQIVREGQRVKAGDQIGTVGNTGNARTTPPHLHFGIYPGRKAVDPLYFVQKQPLQAPDIQIDKSKIGQQYSVRKPSEIYRTLIKKESNLVMITPSAVFTVLGGAKGFYHIRTNKGIVGFLNQNVPLK